MACLEKWQRLEVRGNVLEWFLISLFRYEVKTWSAQGPVFVYQIACLSVITVMEMENSKKKKDRYK